MKKYYTYLVLITSLIGIILSTVLLLHHLDYNFHTSLCEIGDSNGCNVLNRSSASEVFGIPVAYLGFIYYGFIFVLAFFSNRESSMIQWIMLLSLLGFFIDVALLSYSLLVEQTVCVLCAMTYAATFLILYLTYLKMNEKKLSLIPDMSSLKSNQVPLIYGVLFGFFIMIVSGGFFYELFAKGQSRVNRGGSYMDHLEIAQNEFFKAYENQVPRNFRVEPFSKMGPLHGVLNIVEFADFLCPHCRHMAKELDRFSQKHPDEVSITYRHYPLDQACNPAITRPFHQGSCLLAYASYCALKQNKFWDMHHAIYDNQEIFEKEGVSKQAILVLAARLGLNRAALSACMDEKETKDTILMDVEEANEIGINATPTIFVNGRKMDYNENLFENLIYYLKQKAAQVPNH